MSGARARRAIIAILGTYLATAVLLMAVLSGVVSRPLRRLQAESRKIASGDYSRRLSVDSRVDEIHDLSSDLEAMRSNLVGTYARLQKEMEEKEAVEEERRQIESRLQHMQRLESIGTSDVVELANRAAGLSARNTPPSRSNA